LSGRRDAQLVRIRLTPVRGWPGSAVSAAFAAGPEPGTWPGRRPGPLPCRWRRAPFVAAAAL